MNGYNIRNIINSLSGMHKVAMTNLHAAQCEACKSLEPVEAVEVIIRLQLIAAEVDRAFSSDLNRLHQLLADWSNC